MIFPAIDIQDKRSVRLYKGDFDKEIVINYSPMAQAEDYEHAGIKALHVVDLDGAKAGKPVSFDIIIGIRRAFSGIIEVGGGIRDEEMIKAYLNAGIDRIILGSVALKNAEFTKQMLATYGAERIVIGVDGADGKVATEGWLEKSDVDMSHLIREMMAAGAKYFIVTDINRDGTMEGVNQELLFELHDQFPEARIIASGGIRNAGDIVALRKKGIVDCIVGKALYEGPLALADIVALEKSELAGELIEPSPYYTRTIHEETDSHDVSNLAISAVAAK